MLIGFTGKKRQGIDTCTEIALARFGGVRFAFADKLKEFVVKTYNLPEFFLKSDDAKTMLTGVSWKRFPMFKGDRDGNTLLTFRELLQIVGSTMRKVDENIWALGVVNDVTFRDAISDKRLVCISDVRYDNEAALIKALGGFIVKVSRPNQKGDDDQHESEQGISKNLVDAYIVNDATKYFLRQKITTLVLEELPKLRKGGKK